MCSNRYWVDPSTRRVWVQCVSEFVYSCYLLMDFVCVSFSVVHICQVVISGSPGIPFSNTQNSLPPKKKFLLAEMLDFTVYTHSGCELENFRKFILLVISGNLLNIFFTLYVFIIIMFLSSALQSDSGK